MHSLALSVFAVTMSIIVGGVHAVWPPAPDSEEYKSLVHFFLDFLASNVNYPLAFDISSVKITTDNLGTTYDTKLKPSNTQNIQNIGLNAFGKQRYVAMVTSMIEACGDSTGMTFQQYLVLMNPANANGLPILAEFVDFIFSVADDDYDGETYAARNLNLKMVYGFYVHDINVDEKTVNGFFNAIPEFKAKQEITYLAFKNKFSSMAHALLLNSAPKQD